jgi:hypothetical protein
MGKPAPPKDLRRHCRVPGGSPIDIGSTANGEAKSVHATLSDISLGGMRVEAPEPFPIGTLVTLQADAIQLSGSAVVRHVSQVGTKFTLGLELTPETREALIGFSLTD